MRLADVETTLGALDVVVPILTRSGSTRSRWSWSGSAPTSCSSRPPRTTPSATIERSQPQLLILELDFPAGRARCIRSHAPREVSRACAPFDRALRPPRHGAHRRRARGRRGGLRREDRAAGRRCGRRAPRFRPPVYLAGGPRPIGKAPVSAASPTAKRPGGLTRRELEILRLVAGGALELATCPHALGDRADGQVPPLQHLSQARVSNRTEASRWAQFQRRALARDTRLAESPISA